MAYAHCAQPMAPEVEAGPTDFSFGINNAVPEIMDFVQNAPETLNSILAVTEADFWNAGDFMGDDLTTWFGLTSSGNAYSVNRVTGVQTSLGVIAPPGGETWSGCTWDLANETFYCTATNITTSSISSVDFGGLSSVFIGGDGGASPGTIGVASNNPPGAAAAHLVYAYDLVGDNLIEIDITDGTHTIIGPLGYDANFGQGMDFDMDDGTCYIYAFNNDTFVGELRTCNIADGSTALIGVLGGTIPGGLNQVSAGSSVTQFIPVELVSFNGTANGTDVSLNWATASETNNAGFEVQVQNGDDWNVLGWIEGHGTTTEARTYSYTAEGLGVGTHTFRLKQIDYDGAFEYHGNVEVSVETPGTHLISSAYPNPFNPQSQFTLAVAQDQVVTAELFNTLGQRVAVLFTGTVEANQAQLVTIDGAGLASGMYIVRINGERFSDALSVTLLK